MRPHNLYQISWYPGQDRLVGICHCGATREWDDPHRAWAWLLGHPQDHDPFQPPPDGATLEVTEAD